MMTIVMVALLGAAPFEGVIHQRLQMRGGGGTLVVHLSAKGVRSEAELAIGPQHKTSTTVLVSAAAPEQAHVRDASGVWRKAPAEGTGAHLPAALKGKRLGEKKVAGHTCQRVLLTGDGVELEYCLAPKLLGAATAKLVQRAALQPPQVEKALKALGVNGMVLEMTQRRGGTTEVTLTTTRVEAKKLDDGLFTAPK